MVFQQNLLEKAYFIAKMSSPASSDFWKAPLANDFGRGWLAWILAVADPDHQIRGGGGGHPHSKLRGGSLFSPLGLILA